MSSDVGKTDVDSMIPRNHFLGGKLDLRITLRRVSGVFGILAVLALGACGKSEVANEGGPPNFRRLTETQYRNVIADIFGPNITVGGHFDPLVRTNGLLQVGARTAPVTPAGFEEYDRLARSIAAQVVAPGNRDFVLPCAPQSATASDDKCAQQFYSDVGELLYRRPLTPTEIQGPVALAKAAADKTGNFYDGLAAGLTSMLEAPQFLFIVDETEPDGSGGIRLTQYAKATRISFLLWNTTPDQTLLAAAKDGGLSGRGLRHQVDRMLASPRVISGVRAFFSDMLGFDGFETLQKDSIVYPKFSNQVADDAKEQMLRTIADHLVTQKGDYRDIFTTRKTFVSPTLARIYQVPMSHPEGGWEAYEFPADDPHAGIVSEIGFTALYSHPGRSSSTLRGRAIRELLLCQKVPDPPGNVSFDLFNDPNSPHKTARDRLTAHATAATCAGCHKIMDPIGLTLEKFDGAGQTRADENGAAIDVKGNLNGHDFEGSAGLGVALHDEPAATSCLVNRLYSYGVGRVPGKGEKEWMTALNASFADDKYNFMALLRRIAVSDGFYAVSRTAPANKSVEAKPDGAAVTKESKS
jgi:hypothetical protein